jgi:hypothetical protein
MFEQMLRITKGYALVLLHRFSRLLDGMQDMISRCDRGTQTDGNGFVLSQKRPSKLQTRWRAIRPSYLSLRRQ